jgi:septal ring-binding cell division protein DamX
MQVIITNSKGQSETVKALLYAFPKKGNAPSGYTLTLNGEPATVRQTGGGKYPIYIYILIGGVSHYLPKNVVPQSGTDVEVVEEPTVAEPVVAKPVAKPVVAKPVAESVAKPKRQRVPKADAAAAE